jgi:hypothetical protein
MTTGNRTCSIPTETSRKADPLAPAAPAPPSEEERIATLRALGLHGQVRLLEQQRQIAVADQYFPRLTAEEVAAWHYTLPWFCQLADYDGDMIPDEVLADIQCAMALDLFDAYMVWTPRLYGGNPMVVGYIGAPVVSTAQYLLGRWRMGE